MKTILTGRFDGTLASWRRAAVSAVRQGIEPERILWRESRDVGGLFDSIVVNGDVAALPVPKLFLRLAASVACHRDPAKWDALYAVLFRLLRAEPMLLTIVTDPMVHRLVQMHRSVKRAAHKMKAFVRFRRVSDESEDAYVAWFEPAHFVVERTAPFFVTRFPSMRWSILTPYRCVHWDRQSLSFTDGVSRSQAPTEDALEDLWRTYYANTFNPARLNARAMRTEMPRRYWSNLPEARVITSLQRNASARVRAMLEQMDAEPAALPAELEAESPSAIEAPAPWLDIPGNWDAIHDPGVSVARERANVSSVRHRVVIAKTTIDFGVAGWTDPTLLAPGVFYPRECTTPETRLRFYAERYPMVEVDATYYSLPSRATAAAWAARTPDDFTFDIKAHALMTGHPTDVKRLPDWIRRELPKGLGAARVYASDLPESIIDEAWSRFRAALDPIRACGKLGAIMLQFPRWFEPTRESAEMLRRAKRLAGDDLVTIEFRNRAWMEGRIADRTLALLRDLRLSYVIVDAPPGMQSSMPPTVAVTDDRLAVFRLHGRRVSTWEAKNDPVTERYRYLYDRDELRRWIPAVRETAFHVARVHMTFNNNHANYATTNAAEMADALLGDHDHASY